MTAVSTSKREDSAEPMAVAASHVAIRAAKPSDRGWMRDFLRVRWTASTIVVPGEAIDDAALPALIAESHCGLATWRQHGDAERPVAFFKIFAVYPDQAHIDNRALLCRRASGYPPC
jgi:hypothetical protein